MSTLYRQFDKSLSWRETFASSNDVNDSITEF